MAKKRHLVLSLAVRTAVILAVLALAVLIFTALFLSRPQPEPSDTAGELRSVPVMQARPVMVRRPWQGYGTAAAMNTSDVPARVTATWFHGPGTKRSSRGGWGSTVETRPTGRSSTWTPEVTLPGGEA